MFNIQINEVPAIVPKLTETPGETLWAGPELGEHNESALKEILNISTEEFNRLTALGAIGKLPGAKS
jgi:crotonobetainyl-CoA:carnitine CoA-transferase CaiB-like acyl-CoA transferase